MFGSSQVTVRSILGNFATSDLRAADSLMNAWLVRDRR